jgi:hypothetical protein
MCLAWTSFREAGILVPGGRSREGDIFLAIFLSLSRLIARRETEMVLVINMRGSPGCAEVTCEAAGCAEVTCEAAGAQRSRVKLQDAQKSRVKLLERRDHV